MINRLSMSLKVREKIANILFIIPNVTKQYIETIYVK